MTQIHRILSTRRTVSFEFFPPRTEEGVAQLARAVEELEAAEPDFVSVTYGAGGSTRDLTRDLVVGLNGRGTYPAMPHLTCMGHRRDELESLIDDYAANGIDNLLALAGDPPDDGSPPDGDFRYAADLVALARERGEFSIAVAAFPEGHPRSASISDDRRRLAEKLSLADFGITQFFFSASSYTEMVDDLSALGCDTPILPGIMPLLNPATIRRFADMNGTAFPEALARRVEEADPDDRVSIAVEAAVDLATRLLADGAPGIHLYPLNRSEAALAILSALDVS
jgi:methylenetetrahydrofolate reductase (NADPH)